MRRQRYSVRSSDEEKTWLSAKIHDRKRKSAVEGDPKESWSGIVMEVGVE